MHKTIKTVTVETIGRMAGSRRIFIWGAGNQGRGITSVLKEHDIVPSGFIDNSPSLSGRTIDGIRVYLPDDIIQDGDPPPFIIISAFFFEQEISQVCLSKGLKKDVDFIHYSSLKPRDYSIEISGSCNLRCISCPRGGAPDGLDSLRMMSFENFKKVIDKLKQQEPFVRNIQLYQWGEPTLNKHLPDMIRYAGSRGIRCAISSNLNLRVNYRKIIESKPEWLRLSASGWENKYEITHTGGRWPLFLKNLKTVARLRQQVYPEMKIELYYHLYKHSIGKGLLKFETLCKGLDIEFHPVFAYLISLDDVLRYLEGGKLPDTAIDAQNKMLLDLDQGLEMSKKQAHLPCDAFRSILINPDLSVSNCMMFFYPEGNRAAGNFLDESIERIMDKRKSCNLCKRCMVYGLHRYCGVYSTFKPDLNSLAGQVAGENR